MTGDIPRRDPRRERNLRRMAHPADEPHAGGAAPQGAAQGLMRRDPRAERDRRRSLAHQALRTKPEPARQRRPHAPLGGDAAPSLAPDVLRVPDQHGAWCLVVPDAYEGAISSHDRDAFAAARVVADALGAGLIAFAPAGAGDYGRLGADRLVPSDGIEEPEQRVCVVADLIDRFSIAHVVMPDTLVGGGHLGRLLGVRLGFKTASAVVRVGTGPEILRRADGGRRDQVLESPRIMLVAPEAATPVHGRPREAKPLDAPPVPPGAAAIRDAGRLPADPSTIPLADADLIVSAGTGVSDWASFRALAQRLEAAVGCTRAVCDAGHLPRSRQVGASGTLVDPRCYLSFGISGAPQHLQGIARCERVVAVNTDLHAEMIKRAQLAIVADAQAVMAELLSLTEEAA